MDEEEEGKAKDGEDTSWGEVFSRLDKGDGHEDGRIACRDFIDWIDMLSFQDSISLEVSGTCSKIFPYLNLYPHL